VEKDTFPRKALAYAHTAKLRVVALTLVTTATGVLLSGGASSGRFTAALVGTAAVVAGAGALNNLLERDRDALMERTRTRPLPAGRLKPAQVLLFGGALAALGLIVLSVFAGPLSALWGAAGLAYYLGVYTLLLKPRSPHSVVPGGLAGVFPPLIGWAATGRPLTMAVVYLCALVFFWSPPHFWALAIVRADDYSRAGIPTLPVARGGHAARWEIFTYTLAVVGLSLLPVTQGEMGPTYLVTAVVAGGLLLGLSWSMVRSASPARAWLFYRASGPYLALLLVGMLT
jgi:heme o synthase